MVVVAAAVGATEAAGRVFAARMEAGKAAAVRVEGAAD